MMASSTVLSSEETRIAGEDGDCITGSDMLHRVVEVPESPWSHSRDARFADMRQSGENVHVSCDVVLGIL